MTNESIVLCIYLVTGLLLYDLIFDTFWLCSPQVHYIVLLVMAALRAHVVLAVTSLTFPNLSKLPCSLYIPPLTPLGHYMYMICFSVKMMEGSKVVVSFILSIF